MTCHYPFATAPDIIRAAEKDNWLRDSLQEDLSNVLRRLKGSRFVQTHATETRTFAALLYLGCTTLLGNRTLGEEYCDIVQIETAKRLLPSTRRRASYILLSVLLPYTVSRLTPRIHQFLDSKPASATGAPIERSKLYDWHCLMRYVLLSVESTVSPSLLSSVSLAAFYLNGAYYHLSKRVLGLRYVFTLEPSASSADNSYEVLGVLLVLQMLLQGYIHVTNALRATNNTTGEETDAQLSVSDGKSFGWKRTVGNVATIVEGINLTPSPLAPRQTLTEPTSMKWIQGSQQRKCTLCLEELKDPSVTTCGHLFCWTCITDWIREKPECPLCRQSLQGQHVLPLR